jgi:hypothetical protein
VLYLHPEDAASYRLTVGVTDGHSRNGVSGLEGKMATGRFSYRCRAWPRRVVLTALLSGDEQNGDR